MNALDSLRQLYLLLWKNYVLRKRKKVRVVVEIVWPLFLFLILMWVRTRGLRSFEPHCHFAERPLPSSGIFPFLRSYMCELNFSCSAVPRDSYFTDYNLYQTVNLTYHSLKLFNEPGVVNSVNLLIKFSGSVLRQRKRATDIAQRITLGESLSDSAHLTSQLQSIFDSSVNSSARIDQIISSVPDYNYLYSNYSVDYDEPFPGSMLAVDSNGINMLYGTRLDRLDRYRSKNRVDRAEWIRSRTCNSNNQSLLQSNSDLNEYLCSLSDSKLEQVFTVISKQLDITKVKKRVYGEAFDQDEFLSEALDAVNAGVELQGKLRQSGLFEKDSESGRAIRQLFDSIQDRGVTATICGQSRLSLFDIFNSLQVNSDSTDSFVEFLNTYSNDNNSTNETLIERITSFVSNNFEYSSQAFRSYEKYGRKAIKIDRKTNPFLEFSGSVVEGDKSKSNTTRDPNQSTDIFRKVLEAFNGLNKIKDDECPARRIADSVDKATQALLNSTRKSCFCKTMYVIIATLSEDTQVLFRQLKPMLLGKLVWSPDTPAFRRVMERANLTFSNIDQLGKLVRRSADILNDILVQSNATYWSSDIQNIFNVFIDDALATNRTLRFDSSANPQEFIQRSRLLAQAMYMLSNIIECLELNKFEGHANEETAVSAGTKLIQDEIFWAAVVFNETELNEDPDQLPELIKYKIRMNASLTHDTSYTQDKIYYFGASNCLPCNAYFTYGFIYIQDMIEKAVIEAKSGETSWFGMIGQLMPYPCYVNDKFVMAISRTMPLFMVLAWVYTVSMLVKDIVYEKERRLKEFMRVMGLSNAIHWLSWFITSLAIMLITIVILCLILKYGKITTYSDVTPLIVFFTCFTIATITQCFLISVFFNRANLAAVVAGISYFILFLPYTLMVNYDDVILPWQKIVASLSSTVAFSYGCELLAAFELQTKGITWKTFYSTPFSNKHGFSLNFICLILLVDSVIYMLLAWYIEALWPGEFSIPRRWYFPLQPSYWLGDKYKQRRRRSTTTQKSRFNLFGLNTLKDKLIRAVEDDVVPDQELENLNSTDMNNIEIDPGVSSKKAGIRIDKLHKVYSRGNNHALKGLTVNFYENEISAFLGHNGAGKSTTMHLLIGLYTPSAGTAYINDLDIAESMDQIRKSIGFVPQHNVLFDNMTVEEHLWFYARLKGLERDATLDESQRMLDETGLRPKADEIARNLSGGMQRKLSVAIAFVGGSKTVILDEPSAGVDPSGRRSIWDMLFKYRPGRTIVISTHHLDEADVLGDRIAIISNGKLVAHGTSYYLKNKYGRGYYLTLGKKNAIKSSDDNQEISKNTNQTKLIAGTRVDEQATDLIHTDSEEVLLKSLSANDRKINELVKTQMPNACLVQVLGSELTYSISNKLEYTRTYDKFFAKLESKMDELGLDSIGISDSSLEEIFIKLAKQPESNAYKDNTGLLSNLWSRLAKKPKETEHRNGDLNHHKSFEAEQIAEYSAYTKMRVGNGILMLYQQLFALMVKRFHRVRRNIKGFFAEIVFPVVFVCLAMFAATMNPAESGEPILEIHPWYYDAPNQIFFSRSSSLQFDRAVYDPFPNNESYQHELQSNLDEVDRILSTLIDSPGLGTRCLSNHDIQITNQVQSVARVRGDRVLKCDKASQIPGKSISAKARQELISANYSYTKTSPPCSCSKTGFPLCSSETEGSGDIYFRPSYKLKSQDVLHDLSGRNVSDWIINTEFSDRMFRKRYGGFEFLKPTVHVSKDPLPDNIVIQFGDLAKNLVKLLGSLAPESNFSDLQSIAHNLINNRTINSFSSNQNVKVWFNSKGYDTGVAYLNSLNNALLRSRMLEKANGKPIDLSKHGIVLYNHPMPFTQGGLLAELEASVLIELFVAICMVFALSFIPASFLVFLLEERQNNSKQLQFVSGVKPYVYWMSNFSWDLINYIVPCLLCVLIFLFFNVEAYICPENFPCLLVLMLLYGWACIPLMYPLNYLFKVPSTAFVFSSSLNIFIGVATTITVSVLDQLSESEPDLVRINSILKPIFTCLFPHFCLGQGFLQMTLLYNTATVQRSFGYTVEFSPFGFDEVGRNLCALGIQGVVYFTINLLIDYNFFVRFKPEQNIEKLNLPNDGQEDEDVAAERQRIIASENDDSSSPRDYIKLVNLTKIYKRFKGLFGKERYRKHVAVNDLCLGINKGECFGLIGVNGAGKTTTFKMITGELDITGGDVYIGDASVSKQLDKVYQNIGYCPQTDALFPLLTAREHLVFFARLRGIPERYVDKVCEWAMHRVGLQVFADRIAGDFSGGNKRKLSTAIALVGDPTVICLDEPTSGMDAKARRLLWNDILSLIKENRIVILTSHTLEECEALCTRLVIMVNGQFKCLGSPQHLKQKFGSGFLLTVRLKSRDEGDETRRNYEKLIKFIRDTFPHANVQDSHQNMCEFVLPFAHTRLSEVFHALEANRDELNIRDYSLNQTTLDQVFINFAKKQKEDPFDESENIKEEPANHVNGSIMA